MVTQSGWVKSPNNLVAPCRSCVVLPQSPRVTFIVVGLDSSTWNTGLVINLVSFIMGLDGVNS